KNEPASKPQPVTNIHRAPRPFKASRFQAERPAASRFTYAGRFFVVLEVCRIQKDFSILNSSHLTANYSYFMGASPLRGDRAFRGCAIAPAPPTAWLLRTPPIPCAAACGGIFIFSAIRLILSLTKIYAA
ncbi:MAG: hypothetical protein LBP37_07440, partial [Spirochaetaceae bacterium]|nr:hypothetical protein [Spirochaetaceae bacterium]